MADTPKSTVKARVQFCAPEQPLAGYANWTQINRHGTQIELDFFHIPASEWVRATKAAEAGKAIEKDLRAYFVTRVILSVEGWANLRAGMAHIHKGLANPAWLEMLREALEEKPPADEDLEDGDGPEH